MNGIIDMGGGMRDVYSAGVYDCFLDMGVSFDYYLGVSAGSANLISYLAGQRGRNLPFYTEYARRREYMSLRNYLSRGSYIDVNYIYSVLSGTDGEYPLDFESVLSTEKSYVAVATCAADGKPRYFTNSSIDRDNIDVIKASCSLPVICKPYRVEDELFFDGGISDPLPVEKALEDGCDFVVTVLTKPLDYVKQPLPLSALYRSALGAYPGVVEAMETCHEKYNASLSRLRQLERDGQALIIAPDSCLGVNTLTRNKNKLMRLYEAGYRDAKKVNPKLLKRNCFDKNL